MYKPICYITTLHETRHCVLYEQVQTLVYSLCFGFIIM